MSQVLTESITLSLTGGVVGVGARRAGRRRHLRGHAAAGHGAALVGGDRHRHHRLRRPVLRVVSRPVGRRCSTRSRRCAVSRYTSSFALLQGHGAAGVRHAAREQDAVGPDHPRHRHRHHLDRRHDLAHSRLRPVDAELDEAARAEHDLRRQVQRLSLSSGASFIELARRPNITVDDAEAIKRLVTVGRAWSTSGSAPAGSRRWSGCSIAASAPSRCRSWARASASSTSTSPTLVAGRSFTDAEVQRRKALAVIGYGPYESLFRSGRASTRSARRSASAPSSTPSSACMGKRPGLGGLNTGQDDFAIIPYTAFRKQFGSETRRSRRTVRRRPGGDDRRRAARRRDAR